MLPRLFGTVLLAAAGSWAASPVAGDWIGTLKPGPVELRVVLHVKDAGAKLEATLDSIDQGAKGIPVESISLSNQTLTFDSNSIQGHYEGKFDPVNQTIKGTWTQNGPLPLDFARYVEKPKPARTGPPAKPSDIDGAWEGKLDAGGQTLRIVFHLKTDEDGALTATLDSPDQGGYGLPATAVKREGASLLVEMKGLAASYKGTINDARTKIDGTFTQAGAAMPLAIERKPK
jgi:hypothetical protein